MSDIVRVLWCEKCGWAVFIPDGAAPNHCQSCAKKGLSFIEMSVKEFKVLERIICERHGVTADDQ